MLQNRKKDAYPILDGKALIKVSLKGKQEKKLWYENFFNQIRFNMVKNQTKAYFPVENEISFAVVNLSGANKENCVLTNDFELNLAKDEMPFSGKFKLAFGGAVTAGLILLSSWGFAKSTGTDITAGSQIPELSVSQSYSADLTREKNAVVVAETGNESLLLASLMQPGDSHPFQKIGHTNLAPTNHSNASGSVVHTNTDAYSDFTAHSNVLSPHQNANHTNGGHTNQYTNSP